MIPQVIKDWKNKNNYRKSTGTRNCLNCLFIGRDSQYDLYHCKKIRDDFPQNKGQINSKFQCDKYEHKEDTVIEIKPEVYSKTTIVMDKFYIEQKEFLFEYFTEKKGYIVASFEGCKFQENICEAGNDYYNISLFIKDNHYVCRIETCEVHNFPIAEFLLPEMYKDFQVLMDIFLK